jgi:hypothetical protein
VWNKSAMLRHIWNIFAQAGSIWVAWVKENWIKGCSFWCRSTTQAASWSWKQILKLREIAKEILSFKVGDGQNIFLWFDNWHPNGYLLDKYVHRAVHDAGSTIGAKLATVIRDGWNLVELQSRLPEVSLGGNDVPIWKNSTGKYNCADTWNALRQKEPQVDWWKAVWHPVAIHRHSFMLWLVFKGALLTRERMCWWGYIGDCLCLFCRGCIESSDHLFFKCGFSKRIWKELMELCDVENPVENWDDIRAWCGTVLRRDCFKSRLCILCLGVATYHIWKQRNAILHSNNILSEEAIIGKIKWVVKARMIAEGNFQRSMENSRLATLWSLT